MSMLARWGVGLAIAACLATACSGMSAGTAERGDIPVRIERNDATGTSRLVLTNEAVARLRIETAAISEQEVRPRNSAVAELRRVVPYAAVLYDVNGKSFVYTRAEGNTFVRAAIAVNSIRGDRAVLDDGPAPGTAVVIVGAQELFGAEFDFQE